MSRKHRLALPQELITTTILGLTHEGRGIAKINGKTCFVEGGLPGETLQFRYTRVSKSYDEGQAISIIHPSPDRTKPQCQYFNECGGCQLQHMTQDTQLKLKQNTLLEQFKHFGKVSVKDLNPPIMDKTYHYRRKARLGVRYNHKKDMVFVGFRQKNGRFITDMDDCSILEESAAFLIRPLRHLIGELEVKDQIPQIEVAVGDLDTALVFRHCKPLHDLDREKLIRFGTEYHLKIYTQAGGPDSVQLLWPPGADILMNYRYQNFNYGFDPTGFVQIHDGINQRLISEVLEQLNLSLEHRVLDLFCGLGNFTLPIAQKVAEVIGIEGDARLVKLAEYNAANNGVTNAQFYQADLSQSTLNQPWLKYPYDRVLLDPPRTGAKEIIPTITTLKPKKVVYVSCNPATLARDAGLWVDAGYNLQQLGVVDMFPHTGHMESIAVFSSE